MDYAEKEIKVARLAVEENCYILMARGLEEKSAELKELAKFYRERAQALCHQQNKIWQETNES